ncbi:MAG: ABC transporter substrate-binding protein [Rhodobacteraceae bacterium]|nr:ABC transporter substrate-binding protein [Paracoccaceae bacterium]
MPNNPTLTRRHALGTLAVAFGAAILPGASLALTETEASNLIGQMVDDLNGIINSGRSESAMFSEFEALFAKYADVPIIAQSALGAAWRGASAGQRNSYVAAFRGYMARKYGKRFREFIGGKIVVTGTQLVKSGYLVSSVVKLSNGKPFEVEWQVSDKSGRNKMFNMFIEGISLLATERTEIGAMLDRRNGNLNQLIEDLKTAS